MSESRDGEDFCDELARDASMSLERVFIDAPVALAVWEGPEHRYTFVNRAYVAVFGAREYVGRAVREVFPEPGVADAGFFARLDHVYATGEPFTASEHEVSFDREGDGSRQGRSYAFTFAPRRSADGVVEGVIAIASDVSEHVTSRRLAEEQAERLHRREELFRIAQEAAPIAFVSQRIVRDAEGRAIDLEYLYQNPAAARINGLPAGDAVAGIRLLEAFPGLRNAVWADYARVADTGERWHGEVYYQGEHLDGWFSTTASRTGADTLTVTFEDITARKRMEIALRESEERFRTLADGLPFIVWVHDEHGALRWVNATYLAYFDTTEHAVLGEGWQPLTHPDDTAAYAAAFRQAVRARAPFHARVRVRRADGAWRWIESRAQPRFDVDGTYLGHVGSSPDITEQVDALAQLADDDRRKDELIATLAHELRNPLAPILHAASALQRRGPDGAQSAHAQQVIARQATHMARLLDDLLDLARIKRGRLELRCERMDLRDAISTAIETARPELERKRHALDVRVPPTPLWVHADAVRVCQIVANLLVNAAKYTRAGGHVVLEARADGERACIDVQDDGIGIPAASLATVFGMFTRLPDEGEATAAESGLGIGLALVQGLVEMHGGRITVESEGRGHGSRFRVVLPLAQPARATVHAPAGAPRAHPRELRVLVVDDNVDAADMLRMLLELEGLAVTCAYSGTEALDVGARHRPHLAFVDLGMPGMSGLELATRLRATEWGRAMRLVALTGWGQEQDRRRTAHAGFDEHLVKPLDPRELAGVLESAAAHRGRV